MSLGFIDADNYFVADAAGNLFVFRVSGVVVVAAAAAVVVVVVVVVVVDIMNAAKCGCTHP